jgi:hypothetical protein
LYRASNLVPSLTGSLTLRGTEIKNGDSTGLCPKAPQNHGTSRANRKEAVMNCHLLALLFGGILLALLVLRHRQSITTTPPATVRGLSHFGRNLAGCQLRDAGYSPAHILLLLNRTDKMTRPEACAFIADKVQKGGSDADA